MTIRILTDSTCDIPDSLAAAHGITILPSYVNVGKQSYLDGVELSRQTFYRQLPQYESQPTTAAPAVGAFSEAYERLREDGATEILSIHVASDLSGMLNAARLGAQAVKGVQVTLFDSRQVTMGLGFMALAAARAAEGGKSVPEIVARLENIVQRTHTFAVLDTLEFLRRSGRVSWTEFGVGTLLRIKPMVHVYNGRVESLQKVRTFSRALQYLLEHVSNLGALEEIALLHTANPDSLDLLRQKTKGLLPDGYEPVAVEVTPAIGAHVGPGALGLACVTRRP